MPLTENMQPVLPISCVNCIIHFDTALAHDILKLPWMYHGPHVVLTVGTTNGNPSFCTWIISSSWRYVPILYRLSSMYIVRHGQSIISTMPRHVQRPTSLGTTGSSRVHSIGKHFAPKAHLGCSLVRLQVRLHLPIRPILQNSTYSIPQCPMQ